MPTIYDVSKWLWDSYGKEMADKALDKAKNKWQQVYWPKEEERYRGFLQKQHAETFVLDRHITIRTIFTDIYVLERLTSFRRDGIKELEKSFAIQRSIHLEEKRKSLVKIAELNNRLFILGKPGSGKTTFLKYLTLQACSGKLKKTPIFVEMKKWADSNLSLMEFIVKQFDVCAFPDADSFLKAILSRGDAIVLFDGLDEMNSEETKNAVDQLIDFIRHYPIINVCVSCRIGAFEQSLDGFTYVEIADFDERQRVNFVRKWFKDKPEMMGIFLKKLNLSENQKLSELARTPLLLALLCIVFENNHAFPRQLVDLYKEAFDVLLVKWDAKRGITRESQYFHLSLRQKEQLLSRLAAQNFENEKYFFEKRNLTRQIEEYFKQIPGEKNAVDGALILKAIQTQHGLLVERSKDIFSFSHLVFQEFLTAYFIAENSGADTVSRLINTYKGDRRWDDVFLMVFSLLDNSSHFFEVFLKRIRHMVLDEKELEFLISWSNDKASKSKKPGVAHRTIYLFWGLLLIKSRNPNISSRLGYVRDMVEQISQLVDKSVELQGAFLNAKTVSLELSQTGRLNLKAMQKLFGELGCKLNNKDLECEWMLSDAQVSTLEVYLRANLLLLRCLNVGTVRDRKSIESRVLSPIIL